MSSRASEQAPGRALQQLQLLEVAKEMFLSQWYIESADRFFDEEERRVLREVAEDSRDELEQTRRVVEEWAEALESPGSQAPDVVAVARLTRHDFLRSLVEAKEAAWHVYELAAESAPPGVRERLLELGARDLRHANRLRQLIGDGAEARVEELRDERDRDAAHSAER